MVRRAREPTYGYTIQPTLIWTRAAEWLVARQGWSHAPSPECFVFSANLADVLCQSLARVHSRARRGGSHDSRLCAATGLHQRLRTPPRAPSAPPHRPLPRGHGSAETRGDPVPRRRTATAAALAAQPDWPRVESNRAARALAELCASRGVLVVSDEIWADWVLPADGARPFVPFARPRAHAGT